MDDFKTSDSLQNLAPALLAFQREVKDPNKDASNPHFRSKFVPLESAIESIRPVANKHGLTITQWRAGKGLVTMILHESGEYISGRAEMVLDKATPQGMGSATTYERRYSLLGATGTAGDVDDDAEQAMAPHRAPKPATPKDDPVPAEYAEPGSGSLLESFSLRMGQAENLAELKQAWEQVNHAPLTEEQKHMLEAMKDMAKERLTNA